MKNESECIEFIKPVLFGQLKTWEEMDDKNWCNKVYVHFLK